MQYTYSEGDRVLLLKKFYKINTDDIVVFDYNNDKLIKRCIALPGDSIKIDRGKIFVNGNEVITPNSRNINRSTFLDNIFIKKMMHDAYGTDWNPISFCYYLVPKRGTRIMLNSENIKRYGNLIKSDSDEILSENQRYYTFKNDYFYLVGDNREESIDSRFFGPIKLGNIRGKIIFP